MLQSKKVFLFFFLLFSILSFSQEDKTVIPLKKILNTIAKEHDIQFNFIEDEVILYSLISPNKKWSLEEKINYLKKQTLFKTRFLPILNKCNKVSNTTLRKIPAIT